MLARSNACWATSYFFVKYGFFSIIVGSAVIAEERRTLEKEKTNNISIKNKKGKLIRSVSLSGQSMEVGTYRNIYRLCLIEVVFVPVTCRRYEYSSMPCSQLGSDQNRF